MFESRGRRGNRDNNNRHPKPVQRIEVSDKSPKWRLALTIFLGVFGVAVLTYSLVLFLNKEPGWVTIEPETKEPTCADEFVFQYNIGASGTSASLEYKSILSCYTDATKRAFQVFHNVQSFAGVINVRHINANPNKELKIEPVLYNAFETLQQANNRLIYLAPIYVDYNNLYSSNDDTLANEFDPATNAEAREYFDEVLKYINDADSVNIELLGDNTIRLNVSEEYLKYANENGIQDYIDFAWMKNAFIIDYLADTLIEKGFVYGSLSSYDGFVRNLDSVSDQEYYFNIFDRVDNRVVQKDALTYNGQISIVYLKNYMTNPLDKYHYYEFSDGRIYTPYIDIKDGRSKTSIDDIVCYSQSQSCTQMLMQMIPIYISDTFENDLIQKMESDGINCIL